MRDSIVLRIGLLQAQQMVEERRFRAPARVTIGTSPKNELVIPDPDLPSRFQLFSWQGGRYQLRFTEAMQGQVSLEEKKVSSLEEVRLRGLATRERGGLFCLSLSPTVRGKIQLGDFTLIFQFLSEQQQPKPQLPPSVRSGFFASMDWVLTISFMVLSLAHGSFLFYLRTLASPYRIEADVIPDSFAEYVPQVQLPKAIDLNKLAKLGEKPAEKKAAGKGSAAKGRRSQPKLCDAACQQARVEARRARLAEQVSKMGVLKLLGTKGAGTGATRNLLQGGDPGTDTQAAFQGVSGVSLGGQGRGGGLMARSGGAGKGVSIDDLGGRVGGPDAVGTGGMVREKTPKAVVTQAAPQIDGSINSDAAARTIRIGMASVRSCYQRALRRDPKLTGKVTIRMSINTMGSVTRVTIEGDTIGDAQVAACIQSYAQRWRFPAPEGGSAEISVPFVFQAAQ